MVRLLILSLALFSTSSHALTVSGAGVGTITICGQVLSTTNLIHCFGRVNSTSNRSACARAGDNTSTPSDYSAGKGTVGGANAANGKAFRIYVMRANVFTTSGGATIEPFYADNDLGNSSSGSFTNGVNFIGLTNNNGGAILTSNGSGANTTMDQNITCNNLNWLVPNGKFPSFKSDGTAGAFVEYYGYEE